ncbi:hypothetical protein NMQ01_08050 [Janibacter sp. CX7]|uniref:hypothetical protein n=1 Tax=Janibacter sp. CX7 TaxID=2963431 RepID=UPI0020CC4D6D|nr:hypothetical protein [Janibacter sp. CX7]UTT64702.1 hypothetical protein NMQ01_08050 [Janibacter sp. CX7]
MDTTTQGSRCLRAAGASAAVVAWLFVTPIILPVVAARLLPPEIGGGIGYLLPYFLVVAAPFLVPALVVGLAVALGGAHARALPGRSACALGNVSSLVGVATVAATVTLMWLAVSVIA